MNLNTIMLSERSQAKNSVWCVIPFIWCFRNCQLIYSDRRQSHGSQGTGRGVGRGRREGLPRARRKPTALMDKFIIMTVVMIAQVHACVRPDPTAP